MTSLNDWDNAPSVPTDPTLHAHKIGLHDVPEDECPACRVDRGVALLDERRPGWWEDVDVKRLDIYSCSRCVLGQLWGDYTPAADWLDISPAEAIQLGFDAIGQDATDILTTIWRRRISERRAR